MLYKLLNPPISHKQSRIVIKVNQLESLISAFKIILADLIGKLNSLLRKSRSTTATTLKKIQAEALAKRDRPSSPIKIDQKALKKKTGKKINRCSRNAVKNRTN